MSKPQKKVAAITLGCKVNQYETEAMVGLFREKGYEAVPFEEHADVYLVNTCTVTNISDKKSRKLLRKAHRQNPEAVIVACGCYAQLNRDEIMKIDGVSLVLGTGNRLTVVDAVEKYQRETALTPTDSGSVFSSLASHVAKDELPYQYENLSVDQMENRSRAYVKIQDGCENFCTYCIVPYARGPVRSRPADQALAEVKKLAADGHQEIVLTGIQVASYGKDLDNTNLLKLLYDVHRIEGIRRIRFSSLDPTVVDDAFLEAVAALPGICDHFHLSLQSGSDTILRRMNRRYDTAAYQRAVERLRAVRPDAAFTTDIIVGFPGETDALFEESRSFIREIGPAKIHVFPYSPKAGTDAARYPDQLTQSVKDARVKHMSDVGEECGRQFAHGFIGRTLDVLFEKEVFDGVYEGHTSNYMTVRVPSSSALNHTIRSVRIERTGDFTAEGMLAD